MVKSPDVLIVGAGPTGLTAAAEAIRHGLSVRVIDQNDSRSTYSKALAVHSRSLEIFHDMGFVENVIRSGQKFHGLNIYAEKKSIARIVFPELNWQDAMFPYWLSIPQSETERRLEEYLNRLGGSVERCTELINLEQLPDFVRVTLRHKGDSTETVDVPWVVGCDGAHSLTRQLLGLELKGKPDDEVFILGDVHIDWDIPEDEGSNILSPSGIVLIVPMPEPRRYRIIAHMPDLSINDQPEITLKFLQDIVDQRTHFKMRLSDLSWSSVFSTKHFVVSAHRKGRIFLAGDAAHIHSPVGGQGLNSGIQDAYNLMWKLALVHGRRALPILLDSYTAERHEIAQSLITNVSAATQLVTLRMPLAQKLRNRLAGFVLNTNLVRNWMGRGVAMLDIKYKESPAVSQDLLSSSVAKRSLGRIKNLFGAREYDFERGPSPGMRAPNAVVISTGTETPSNLYDFYRGTHHTLMIFTGVADSPDLKQLLQIGAKIQSLYQAPIQFYVVAVELPSRLPAQEHILMDSDKNIHKAYASWGSSVYLIRPDKHIAYRSQMIDQNLLTAYLDRILVPNP